MVFFLFVIIFRVDLPLLGLLRLSPAILSTIHSLILSEFSLSSLDPFFSTYYSLPSSPTPTSPSYLETQHDVDTLVRGVRLLVKLAKTPGPLASLIVQDEKNPGFDNHLDTATDEEIADMIRERGETM